jgi:glycosyltransferase involved in cell wall biosynthesis
MVQGKQDVRFSVVITTYNRLKFLKKAIASAFSQTVPCEVIVVDDCSSDGTAEYCRKLKKIKYIRNKKNSGHSFSVNAGVRKAKGNWIKFLDDDDYLAENCIEEFIKAIEKHPKAVICSAGLIEIDEKGNEIRKQREKLSYAISQEDIHYGMLLDLVHFGTASQVAVRKDAFLKSGGWDEKFDVNFDDTYCWLKTAEHGDGILIGKNLVYRTIWPGGYNEKFSLEDSLKMNIEIKREIYSRIAANKPKWKTIENYMKLHWFLAGLKRKKIMISSLASVFSPSAWSILAKSYAYRKGLCQEKNIRLIRI